jgi:hypothetical protein
MVSNVPQHQPVQGEIPILDVQKSQQSENESPADNQPQSYQSLKPSRFMQFIKGVVLYTQAFKVNH